MATSGSFTGARGGSSTGPYLKLSWSRIAVDEVNNKSKLRLTLQLVADYSISFSSSKTGVLEGNSFTYSGGMSGTGTKTLKTLDIWYTHNSNGSLTTTLDATFNIAINWGGNYVSSLSVSGSATIDTIPRASDFTAFTLSNTVLNTSTATTINYTLGRKSTSFSQDMTLKYGSKVIASWNTTGTGALTRTLSAAEVNSIIVAMPTVTSGNLTLTMQTKSGSTKIGSPKSINEGISLNAAIKPTVTGLTASIYGSGRDKTINKYVQGISKVTASFTSTPGYGTSMSSNTIVVRRQSDNANSQTISSNSGTTANPVSLSGVYAIIATAKDRRGRTNTQTITITVEAYSPPSISKFTTIRSTVTSSNVIATITAAWSPLGTNNPTNISIVGVNNVGTSQTLYTLNNSTAGSINTTQTYTGQSDASSFEYTMTVTDSFGKVAKAVATVGTSFVELTIAKGLGVGIGKVHERGALDVAGSAYFTRLVAPTISLTDGDYERDVLITRASGVSHGFGIGLGAGGTTVIAAGESASYVLDAITDPSDESLYLVSDYDVYVGGGQQSGYDISKMWKFDRSGYLVSPNWGSSGVRFDVNGNIDAPSSATTGSYWNITDHAGNIRVMIPLHNNAYHSTNSPMPIQLGQFYFYSGYNGSSDSSSKAVISFREYSSENWEYILMDDATNGFYFGADSKPAIGGVGAANAQLHAAKFNVVSDKERKENIEEFGTSALDLIKGVKAHKYDHKRSKEWQARHPNAKFKKSIGLIAQEAPSEITTDTGLGIDLYAMNTVLWKAVQELSEQVDFLNKKLKRR